MGTIEVLLNTFCLMIWLQVYGGKGVVCGGLSGECHPYILYIYMLVLSSSAVREGLGRIKRYGLLV